MEIKEENFPVYQFLISQHASNPGVQFAMAEFKKAQTGSDDEKFNFAYGIQTGLSDKSGWIPGTTEDMAVKTLQSCLAVFEDLASRDHVTATGAAAYFYAFGFGCAKDLDKANDLIEKAAALSAAQDKDADFTKGMASMIPPRPVKSPTQKSTGFFKKFF